jgi:GTP-binding protein
VSTAPLPTVLDASFLVEVRPGSPLPPPGPPEIAIAGRSNVGKSTLLNRLAARRSLARTSKTPGRTRGAIFYELAVRWTSGGEQRLRLVDLPGYGYAQVSQAERKSWQPLIEGYVERRQSLALFLSLVDARREIEEEERQLDEWLATLGVRRRVVVTKIDKVGSAARGALLARIRRALGPDAPPPLAVSGETGEGMGPLWSLLAGAVAAHGG